MTRKVVCFSVTRAALRVLDINRRFGHFGQGRFGCVSVQRREGAKPGTVYDVVLLDN